MAINRLLWPLHDDCEDLIIIKKLQISSATHGQN
jgi:hypothetical protein